MILKIKQKKRKKMCDAITVLYNKQFEKYYDKFENIFDANHKFKPATLRPKDYDYKGLYTKKESNDKTWDNEKEECAYLTNY